MPEIITYPEGYCDTKYATEVIPKFVADLAKYKTMHLEFEKLRRGQRAHNVSDLVSYANYVPSDLNSLLQQNPTAKYIRFFNGINSNSQHITFMVAVDMNETVLDVLVVENCCQCPPRCTPANGGF